MNVNTGEWSTKNFGKCQNRPVVTISSHSGNALFFGARSSPRSSHGASIALSLGLCKIFLDKFCDNVEESTDIGVAQNFWTCELMQFFST